MTQIDADANRAQSTPLNHASWLLPIVANSNRGDVVVEQPTTGEECCLFIPNPTADDTQVGECVRDRLDVSDSGVGLGLGGIHGFPALDQVAQQPPLGAVADFGRQTLHEWLPLAPTRRNGIVPVMEKQLRQVGMVPRPGGQVRTRVSADQPSRLPIEQD